MDKPWIRAARPQAVLFSTKFTRRLVNSVSMSRRGLSSMPSRGRRLVESELSSGASAPARDIAKARKNIAEVVLGMAARNEIELAPPPEDEAA